MMTEYKRWLQLAEDEALRHELLQINGSEDLICDAFGSELSFGTGGLRGKIGAGTARMNIYTVSRATAGLAKYLKKSGGYGVAIGYDTRKYSRKFAERCAEILASFGIKAYIYDAPLPTPMLSYAVRELKLSAGIMITASHNPAIYNGYKVYGADGCQITDTAADEIFEQIKASDYFEIADLVPFSELIQKGSAEYISGDVYQKYLDTVSKCSALSGDSCDRSIKIVYTPLNGTGYRPVSDILKKGGFNRVSIVSEQALPDEDFTSCKKPNPELDEALQLGLLYAEKNDADILIATDPDCDRVGVVTKKGGGYRRLSGNEVGLLLFEYLLLQKKSHNLLPAEPLCIKTIVTTPLVAKIAAKYNVQIKDVLTGFKYIGEEIGRLEDSDSSENFILGFEESCGYLGGSYVRDKDGVYAALLVSEMAAFYKAKGLTLSQKLDEIYQTYGFCKDKLISHEFDTPNGKDRICEIMTLFRSHSLPENLTVTEKTDYLDGIGGLPRSDVLSFAFEGGDTLTVRPSGTEPKIKFYYYTIGEDEAKATEKMQGLVESIESFIK